VELCNERKLDRDGTWRGRRCRLPKLHYGNACVHHGGSHLSPVQRMYLWAFEKWLFNPSVETLLLRLFWRDSMLAAAGVSPTAPTLVALRPLYEPYLLYDPENRVSA
jgi:hypothetical protein